MWIHFERQRPQHPTYVSKFLGSGLFLAAGVAFRRTVVGIAKRWLMFGATCWMLNMDASTGFLGNRPLAPSWGILSIG